MLAFHSLRDPTQISQPHVVWIFPRGPPISVPASRNRAGPSRPCLCPTAGLAHTPPTLPPPFPLSKSPNARFSQLTRPHPNLATARCLDFSPWTPDFSSRESKPRRAQPTLPLPHRRASPDPDPPTPSPSYTHRKSLNTPDNYLLGKNAHTRTE